MFLKSFRLIFSSYFLILSISFLISLVLISFGEIIPIDFMSVLFSSDFKGVKASTCSFNLLLQLLFLDLQLFLFVFQKFYLMKSI